MPETGIVDYVEVAAAMARRIRTGDAEIRLGSPVLAARRFGGETILETPSGAFACPTLVNCAGLQSDRVARMTGAPEQMRVIPFRGDYCALRPHARSLVRGLVYPVPVPGLPFLGVHLTRRIDGEVWAGTNAGLALWRNGRFEDATPPGMVRDGGSHGVNAVDFDRDGDLDLYCDEAGVPQIHQK